MTSVPPVSPPVVDPIPDPDAAKKAKKEAKASAVAERNARSAAKRAEEEAIAVARQKKYTFIINIFRTLWVVGTLIFIGGAIDIGRTLEKEWPLSFGQLLLMATTLLPVFLTITGQGEVPGGKEFIISLFGRPAYKRGPGYAFTPWPVTTEEVDNAIKPVNVLDTLVETTLAQYPDKDATPDDTDTPKSALERTSLVTVKFKEVSLTLRYVLSQIVDLNDYFIFKMDWDGVVETIKDFVQSSLRTYCRKRGLFQIMQDLARIVDGKEGSPEEKARKLRLQGIRFMVEQKIRDAHLPLEVVALVINESPEPTNLRVAEAMRGKAEVQLLEDKELADQKKLLKVQTAKNRVARKLAQQAKKVLDEKAKAYADPANQAALVLEAQLAALQAISSNPGAKYIFGSSDLASTLAKLVSITGGSEPPKK